MGRKISPKRQFTGFTLIELLIVVIIIAMAVSIISVAVGGDADEDEARKQAEEFFLSANYLSEQAVFRGETYGAFFYPKEEDGETLWCYDWQRIRDAQWQPLEELSSRCLPPRFEVEILIDNLAWKYDESLEYQDPVMGFYPSGEGSAMVNLRFFRESSNDYPAAEEELSLTPTGEVHWVTEEQRLEAAES
jgi:general secretion pathway protein H